MSSAALAEFWVNPHVYCSSGVKVADLWFAALRAGVAIHRTLTIADRELGI
jgi:hypothetical protein